MHPKPEYQPSDYPWRERFPDAALVLVREGGAVYAAEDSAGQALWIIRDESTLAEFLPASERESLISLNRYPTRARAQWVTDVIEMRRQAGRSPEDANAQTWPGRFDAMLIELLDETARRVERHAAKAQKKRINERDDLHPCCLAVARTRAPRWTSPATVSSQLAIEFEAWPRLGNVDLALSWPGKRPVLLELKCGNGIDALGECVWDAAKLAFAMQCDKGSAMFLLAGAPVADWERPVRGAEFFADGPHDAALLRVLYGDWWREWEKRGDPQPAELPQSWWTEHVHTSSLAVNHIEWQLRLVRVFPYGGRIAWPRLRN